MPDFDKPPISLEAAPVIAELHADLAQRTSALREAGFVPQLVIATDNNDPVIQKYITMKQRLGDEIGVDVRVASHEDPLLLAALIKEADRDPSVNGIIVQLPLAAYTDLAPEAKQAETAKLLDLVSPEKDVDGLAQPSDFKPATAIGVMSLLKHYVPDFRDQFIALYGRGRLVNAPLEEMLRDEDTYDVATIDVNTSPAYSTALLRAADIIIAATGQPHSLTLERVGTHMPKIVIDAGTAEQGGVIRGDVAPDLRSYASSTEDWGITPLKGGVGPTTVHSLHLNVIKATETAVKAGTARIDWPAERQAAQNYADLLAYGEPA